MTIFGISIDQESMRFLGQMFLTLSLGMMIVTLFSVLVIETVTFHYRASIVAGIFLLASIVCIAPLSKVSAIVMSIVLISLMFGIKIMRDVARLRSKAKHPLEYPKSLRFWQVG